MAAPRFPLFSPAAGPRLLAAGLRGWTALVLVFLYLPVLVLVVYSFNAARLGVGWEGFSGRWYAELLQQAPLQRAALNSLVVAGATTLLSVVLGTLGAWLLHRYRFPGRDLLEALVNLPMVMPEILLGISLLVLFALTGVGLGLEDGPVDDLARAAQDAGQGDLQGQPLLLERAEGGHLAEEKASELCARTRRSSPSFSFAV